jgi:type II secretory pathway component PulF
MYRAMVAAGEHAGFLGPVLEQLADYAERRQHTSQKLRMAMIYPFILLGVAVAVIVALMVFVVPELIGIFAHSNRELPPLTRALIATSDFFRGLRCGCAWRWCSAASPSGACCARRRGGAAGTRCCCACRDWRGCWWRSIRRALPPP